MAADRTAMYSTCLHCNAALGRNDVVEHFSVGRRLAFDASKGRLWVVCQSCRRWNLTPLDQRWEAIEECERLFRATRLRTSTDNIGLGRAAGGLDLVRIGTPQRKEIAAWRYGIALQRRWRSHWRLIAEHAPSLSMATTAGTILYISSGSVIISLASSATSVLLSRLLKRNSERDIRARVVLPDGQVTDMRTLASSGVSMAVEEAADGGWRLRCSRGPETHYSRETESIMTLRGVLAHRNAFGGDEASVARAVDRLVGSDDAPAFIRRLARAARTAGIDSLSAYPAEALLALEMAVHDDSERRAMEGELDALAAEWEIAEEIAGISDDMFMPASITERLRTLRGSRDAP
ncbi:hypothetical protein BH09GEM1_BH09GEM1_19340 [soil metagenome]